MGRGTLIPLLLVVACGTAVENTWMGDGVYDGGVDAWYLDYPESENSVVASAIDVQANGFSVGDGLATVHMSDMTCGVHVASGSITFDLDLRDGEIQDGLDRDNRRLELTSLLVAAPIVNLIPVHNPSATTNYLVHGVREARLLTDTDFVALATTDDGQCQLRTYRNGHADGIVDLAATCYGVVDLAVDRRTGQAWVAGPDGVFSVDGDTVTNLDLAGDLVAFEPNSGRLYVAERGQPHVHALDADGVAWTKTMPGSIIDLDDGGLAGGVALVHEMGLAHSIVRLDHSGATRDTLVFDQPVLDVEISDRGDLMAVARLNDHAYYRID